MYVTSTTFPEKYVQASGQWLTPADQYITALLHQLKNETIDGNFNIDHYNYLQLTPPRS